MPTYPYRCTQCSHEFEEFQAITEEPLDICPKCGGKIHRIITGGGGLLFKGSGFYQTDYRSKSYRDSAAKEKSDGASSTSSESKKKTDSSSS